MARRSQKNQLRKSTRRILNAVMNQKHGFALAEPLAVQSGGQLDRRAVPLGWRKVFVRRVVDADVALEVLSHAYCTDFSNSRSCP